MSITDKRAEIIMEIMKYKEHNEGIMLQDLYRLIEEHPQYKEIFGGANKVNPKQYQNSTRALLQHRAPESSQYEDKFPDFLNVMKGSGRWTYHSNPKFEKFIKTKDEVQRKLKWIEGLNLNTEEKTALIKVRLNQTSFRKRLIEEMDETVGHSPIKHVNRTDLLIASHIVDHADCGGIEDQANYFNGLILTPDVDKLFDCKLISFDEEGRIIIGEINKDTLTKMGVNINSKLPKTLLTSSRKDFLRKRNALYKFK